MDQLQEHKLIAIFNIKHNGDTCTSRHYIILGSPSITLTSLRSPEEYIYSLLNKHIIYIETYLPNQFQVLKKERNLKKQG